MASYAYTLRMAPTAFTAAHTLLQVKTGAAPIRLVRACISQVTKTSSELQAIQVIQFTATPTFSTVTSTVANPNRPKDPAALAVNGTTATGVASSSEGSGGTSVIMVEDVWNILNGSWLYVAIPDEMIGAAQNALGLTVKLNTAPAASQTCSAYLVFLEDQ